MNHVGCRPLRLALMVAFMILILGTPDDQNLPKLNDTTI